MARSKTKIASVLARAKTEMPHPPNVLDDQPVGPSAEVLALVDQTMEHIHALELETAAEGAPASAGAASAPKELLPQDLESSPSAASGEGSGVAEAPASGALEVVSSPADEETVEEIARRKRWSLSARIRVCVGRNPKRPGTIAWDAFARYRDGMTVREYLEDRKIGKRRAREALAWDLEPKRGFVRLED